MRYSILGYFLPFYIPNGPKNKNFYKMKQNSMRFHHLTYVYQRFWSHDVQFLRYGAQWTNGLDRQDKQMENVTYRGGCSTEKYGAPPSIYTPCNVIFTSTKSCPCQNLKIFQCNDIIKSRSTLQWNGSLVTINWFLRSLSWPRIFLTTSSFM